MKFMGATCLSDELGCLKKKKKKNTWVSSESSRSTYRVFTGAFKPANSKSSGSGV